MKINSCTHNDDPGTVKAEFVNTKQMTILYIE